MSEGPGDGAFGGTAVVPATATCAEGGQTAAGGTSFPQVVAHRVALRGGDVLSPPRPFDPADTVDHLGGARFAGKPASGYHGSAGSGRVMLRNHRDYDIRIDPPNIPPATAAEKRTAFLDDPGSNRRAAGWSIPAGTIRNRIRTSSTSFLLRGASGPAVPRRSNGTPWTAQDGTGTPNAFPVLEHSGLPSAASVSRPPSAWHGTPPG
ncbi:hypothetical protein OG618_35375 [Kitasatospora sp. NBC_01246]|uniref:hypothetical protein n=1 Tax=Kitasatospora sp. NBC_01246 TaxID=2903570 RepID=UPI002E35D353|nr:hypothetical protein [Kitasatospora sp. NBC_01246]